MDEGRIRNIPMMLGCTKDDILTPKDSHSPTDDPLYRGCLAFSHKLESLGRSPAYVYYFTRDLPGDTLGAWHSSELWYMFGTLHRCWRPWTQGDYALSARMLDYWTQFMRTGDPNGGDRPTWRPCDSKDNFVLQLDIYSPAE